MFFWSRVDDATSIADLALEWAATANEAAVLAVKATVTAQLVAIFEVAAIMAAKPGVALAAAAVACAFLKAALAIFNASKETSNAGFRFGGGESEGRLNNQSWIEFCRGGMPRRQSSS